MTTRGWISRLAVLAVGAVGLLQTGCSTMNQTEKGVLGGGAIGAGLGTLIGSASGNPKTGAVVGGLLGAGVGGMIGNDADRQDEQNRQVLQAEAAQAYRNEQPGRIAEIIDLTRQGQDETVILNHIRNNRMTFVLSAADLNTLRANNVSPQVIAAMQNSTQPAVVTRPSRPVVVREEVIVEQPVYIRRAPPPPVVVYDPWCRPGFHVHGRW
jgi:hypothetical protein